MRKIGLSYNKYELKFFKPFETSGVKISSRKGFIINLRSDSGFRGTGDICPFPEFGSESFEEAEKLINDFRLNININTDDIETSLTGNFADIPHYPAVKCGLEQALLTLISMEKDLSLNYLLNRKSRSVIPVNAVIDFRDPVASAKLAESFVEEGFTTIKIKAGRDNFKEDLACISRIRQAAGRNIKLRLDINGKWKYAEAKKYIRELEEFNIEYIEQPVNSYNEFCELSAAVKIPLAVDEGVRSYEEALRYIKSNCVKYIILKPMMLGGIIPLTKIYDEAVKNNIGIVVTSSFESSIGRGYAVFAASLIEQEIAHGLSTQNYFKTKLLPETFAVKNGVIRL